MYTGGFWPSEQVYVCECARAYILLLSIDCLARIFVTFLVCKTRLGVRRISLLCKSERPEMKTTQHDSQNIPQSIEFTACIDFIVCTGVAANTFHLSKKNRLLSSESMGFVVWPIWWEKTKLEKEQSLFFVSSSRYGYWNRYQTIFCTWFRRQNCLYLILRWKKDESKMSLKSIVVILFKNPIEKSFFSQTIQRYACCFYVITFHSIFHAHASVHLKHMVSYRIRF